MTALKRALVPILLVASTPAFAQSKTVPTCNTFSSTGVPAYLPPGSVGTPSTNCTDYFGSGNWANSPLPIGNLTGVTLISGGSGYVNPSVVITDANPGFTKGVIASATVDPNTGAITAVTLAAPPYAGFMLPQITIVDSACGGTGQPACGTGALATGILGGPFTGGIPKFQAADTLTTALGGLQIAAADATTFPGSDYYEIGLVQYKQSLHSSLPATTLRGYVQFKTGSAGCSAANYVAPPSYLGPTIVAATGRPVRVKFTNCLPTGAGGDLFIPVDTTYMGAGMAAGGAQYTANRATLHLHGGVPAWISDGTPHQWTVPVGETTTLQRGVSAANVPDMWFVGGAILGTCQGQTTCNVANATNDPGQGSLTFYWTNQQGGRLLFYHDHAYGLTRLNVYAGEAAGYYLYDPGEENALFLAGAPGTLNTTSADAGHLVPLVIQDKTFVPSAAQINYQDPTWGLNFGTTPGTPNAGDLWFPHVYTTNQNPADPTATNGFGRWDYGPWFIAPQTSLTAATPPTAVTTACTSAAFPTVLAPNPACPTCGCPIIPNASGTPEGFMDTPIVNGKAYPVLHVAPEAYRFQILSAGNDRSLNLSWFIADATQNNTEVAMVPAAPPAGTAPTIPLCSSINAVTNPGLVMGLPRALLDASGNPLNGTGLPSGCWPNYGPQLGIPAPQTMWAADGRAGGAPDPRNAGPAWIQIGTEAGLLASPVVIPPTPVNYEQNTRSVTIGNVAVHGLWLGPAERADVIVDFSKFAGKTLILYNDAPAPAPAFDSRLDYFTGDPDQSPIGGAPTTQPGYGPNTRTIMQVIVDGTPSGATFNLATLKTAFKPTATTKSVFDATQPAPIVPEAGYGAAYGTTFGNTYAALQANAMVFTPMAPLSMPTPVGIGDACPTNLVTGQQCATFGRKAIQELFTLDYGRMNATLGTELPLTNFTTQTTIPLGYIDPPTEIFKKGDTQLWKITHNGVDTHFIHFHLFDVQVVNRVGWDGSMRPPDENEIGWKDTVRMNPLEDIVVAVRPLAPDLPWPVPNSVHFLDVTNTNPADIATFTNLDPFTNNPANTNNVPQNFGWEYVWHCHILGHEENDMMRAVVMQVPPPTPVLSGAAVVNGKVNVIWPDNSASETGFEVWRDTTSAFTNPTKILVPASTPTNAVGEGYTTGATITATDGVAGIPGPLYYQARAIDDGYKANVGAQTYNATPALMSGWSQTVTLAQAPPAVTLTGAPASAVYRSTFTVTATTSAGAAPSSIAGTAGVCNVGTVSGTSPATATVTMISGTGTCVVTATWAATGNWAAASATQSTTATKATPTVTITPPTAVVIGQPATITVSVTSTLSPGPTGTVTVSAPNTTGTCTITLIAGTGSCPLTFTASGAKTVTATYNADANFATASRTATEQVRDFGMTLTPNAQTGNGNVKYTVTVTSVNGFTGSVALTCAGTYPSTYSCSYSSNTVTPPANGSVSSTLTVKTVNGSPGTYNVTATGRYSYSGGSLTRGPLTSTVTTTK